MAQITKYPKLVKIGLSENVDVIQSVLYMFLSYTSFYVCIFLYDKKRENKSKTNISMKPSFVLIGQ